MSINYWHPFIEGNYYHIYNHAAGDKDLFLSEIDYQDFLNKFNRYFNCFFDTIAYCLMPNHFHLLVRVKELEDITFLGRNIKSSTATLFRNNRASLNNFVLDQFRKFFSSYALAHNHRNNVSGQLFRKKFKRVSFHPKEKLDYLICYIHHNPIHHGFTSSYPSWQHSSYQEYFGVIQKEIHVEIIELFGGLQKLGQLHEEFRLNFNGQENL